MYICNQWDLTASNFKSINKKKKINKSNQCNSITRLFTWVSNLFTDNIS